MVAVFILGIKTATRLVAVGCGWLRLVAVFIPAPFASALLIVTITGPRPTTSDVHNFCNPSVQIRLATGGPRILSDLVSTHFLTRFVLFYFLSFAYISALTTQIINSVIISVLRHPS